MGTQSNMNKSIARVLYIAVAALPLQCDFLFSCLTIACVKGGSGK